MLFLASTFVPLDGLWRAEEKPLPGEGTEWLRNWIQRWMRTRPELSADAAFMSQYVWRGYGLQQRQSGHSTVRHGRLYKGFSPEPVGQPGYTNYAAMPYEDDSKWNETDMTFSYSHSFGIVGLEAGYIYYALDGRG